MDLQLADLVELIAGAAPERTALVWGAVRRTYGELDDRATRLAQHLRGVGVGAGDHVAVYARNRPEWVEAMLAAFKLRAAAVNVNYRYVDTELAALLDDADAVAVVAEAGYRHRLDAVRPRLDRLRTVLLIDDGYEEALAAAPGHRDFEPRSGDDRYLLYTGGTTGLPKGTVWRHADLLVAALQGGRPLGEPISEAAEILEHVERPPGVLAVTAPLMHASGQWATLIGLLTASVVVLVPGSFDPHRLWATVEAERVQIVNLVGDAMVRPALAALAEGSPRGPYDTSSVFVVSSGGAVLSPSVKEELVALLPDVVVVDGFGASETGNNGRAVGVGADGRSRFQVDATTAVLDDDLRPVRPGSGVVGRLARRGAIPLGYHKDPVKTAETFVEVDGERWVIPGDAAVVEADGSVLVLGRGSASINTGGEKVFAEEVEAAVKSHPAVYDAVVVGAPSPRWGEEVVVVAHLQGPLSLEELADHLRSRLADYKIPHRLVTVTEVRRTETGKPDYPWARSQVEREVTTGADSAR